MTIETIVHVTSIAVGVITLGGCLVTYGKWTEKVSRYDKHIHDLRNELQALAGKFVSKEIYDQREQYLTTTITEIKTSLVNMERNNVNILIALGELKGHKNVENV